MKTRVVLCLIVILTTSSLISVSLASTSIPKPSVPEFTLKLVDNSYDEPTTYSTDPYTGENVTHPGYHVERTTLEIAIKNQPFAPYHDDSSGWNIEFYYNIRIKGHFSEDWIELYRASDGYPTRSDSEYTVISLGILGENGLSLVTNAKMIDVPSGAQVDFQVEAMIGYVSRVYDPHATEQLEMYPWQFTGETSNWSNTQTITIGESQTPTPSPSSNVSQTQISISVEALSTSVGSAVNVKGRVSDLNGNPLTGKSVTLSYALVDSISWVPIGSGTTDEAGEYNIQWVNTASGTFTLKAEWKGNAEYLGASATTTLSFLPYENQNFFFFESNSTVTALAFNNASSELSFTVEGATGTTGYVKVTIAKNLVSNGANMRVYLDGNQLN